jgi:DNA-binding transcriptional LysR family regulator
MELRHFRYFIAVAQELHFTRAAGRLGISPPTLTRQIQELETEMGVRLFVRTQRVVRLTPAGEKLLVGAQKAIEQFDAAQRDAVRESRGESGSLSLGYVASAAYSGVMQAHVAAFRQAYPDVTLSACELGMNALPPQVRNGALDLAYVRSPMNLPDGVSSLTLQPEPFILALPAAHWLQGIRKIVAASLVDETFILPEQISGTLALGKAGNFVPRLGGQPGSLVAVLTLVSIGEGVAIVPSSARGHIDLPNLVYRDVAGFEMSSYLSLVFRKHEKAATVRRFIETVKSASRT